jgi:hypothetical protein
MIVTAEIGFHPEMGNRNFVILKQTVEGKEEVVMMLMEEENHLITTIEMCFAPDPKKAIGLGIFPQ